MRHWGRVLWPYKGRLEADGPLTALSEPTIIDANKPIQRNQNKARQTDIVTLAIYSQYTRPRKNVKFNNT